MDKKFSNSTVISVEALVGMTVVVLVAGIGGAIRNVLKFITE